MLTPTSSLPPALERMARDVTSIAARLAGDNATREDLAQEMFCLLITLPPGRPRRFYLRALNRRAFNYWARRVVDAPMKNTGEVLLGRRMICVGGLRELERIHQRQRAA